MTVRSKWLPLILLLMAIVEICGCEKKVPAPKDEPQIVEPMEPPGFEIPPYDPEVAVPPIIIPSISGPTDEVSIDSIKALFVGKWEMIGYVGEEGGLVASSGEISEYLSDETIPTTFIPNDPDLVRFYRVDSVNFIIGIYENGVSNEMNDQVYTYQFFEDKLKLDWVQGIRDHGGWFHSKIFIYKRIK